MATEHAGYAPHVEKGDAINGGSHHQHGGHHAPNHQGPVNGSEHGLSQQMSYQGPVNAYGYGQNHRGFTAAEGGTLNPGMYQPFQRKFANPAPLGLSAFALTTFVLSLVNMEARGVEEPTIVVPLAFAYGGLVQLLAGMWEMAVGNTFGATALSSYGGFWIAYALLLTPSPWMILEESGPYMGKSDPAVGFFLTGWFIFTTILLLCTLRSTVAFFLLFFTLDLAFLFLSVEHYAADMGNETAAVGLKKTGGFFGLLAAFLAWYNALAGIQDSSNSFFTVPVIHFPWSDKGKELRAKKSNTV